MPLPCYSLGGCNDQRGERRSRRENGICTAQFQSYKHQTQSQSPKVSERHTFKQNRNPPEATTYARLCRCKVTRLAFHTLLRIACRIDSFARCPVPVTSSRVFNATSNGLWNVMFPCASVIFSRVIAAWSSEEIIAL